MVCVQERGGGVEEAPEVEEEEERRSPFVLLCKVSSSSIRVFGCDRARGEKRGEKRGESKTRRAALLRLGAKDEKQRK